MKKFLLIAIVFISFRLSAQETVYLTLEVAEITATEKIYNLIVDDFDNMIGWQYTMLFNGTEMKFKEIRNSILEDLDSHDFNELYPGVLLTSWIVTDLDPEDYPDPTIALQIVFELFEPQGSGVCFAESPLEYEFIRQEVPGQGYLTEVIINDDCHQDFPIALNTTGSNYMPDNQLSTINNVHLSNDEIEFRLSDFIELELNVYDLSGRMVNNILYQTYTIGSQSAKLNNHLPDGMYLVQAIAKNGQQAIFKTYTK